MRHPGRLVLRGTGSAAALASVADGRVVGIRRSRAIQLSAYALISVVLCASVWNLVTGVRDGSWPLVVFGLGLGTAYVCWLVSEMREASGDARRSYALGVDRRGIRFRHLPVMPWSSVRSVELRKVRFFGSEGSYSYMAVGVQPPLLAEFAGSLQRGWFSSSRRHAYVEQEEGEVLLAVGGLEYDPEQVVEIVQAAWRHHDSASPASRPGAA